jgi:hypothetical protein
MEMAEMLKLLLARLDKNAKTSQQIMLAMREEKIQEMRADREQRKADMEEILSKMEERMTVTQAKTDGKLKELTETIEKTQIH